MTLFMDAVYAVSTNVIIWSICIGVNLGFIYNYINKNLIGAFVRRVLDETHGEDSAKTMSELGYKKFGFFKKVLLKDGGSLRRYVSVAGGKIPRATNEEGVEAIDWDSARFYVSLEQREKTHLSYSKPNKWIFLPIFMVLSVLISIAMTYIMPFFIEALPFI
ncbi:MAG: hypothetical protein IKC16_04225 [Clostridia bacterium]|nr:hypothetical protein [Clostridia bacterium]